MDDLDHPAVVQLGSEKVPKLDIEHGLLASVQELLRQQHLELRKEIDCSLVAHHDRLLRQLGSPRHDGHIQAVHLAVPRETSTSEQISAPRTPKVPSGRAFHSFAFNELQKKQRSKGSGNLDERRTKLSETSGGSLDQAKAWCSGCQDQLRRVISSQVFEVIVSGLILSNVLFLGIEVQSMKGTSANDSPAIFRVVEMIYACSFTLELALRIVGLGPKVFVFGEDFLWNAMDSLLVGVSLVELSLVLLTDVNPKLEYVRIIRIARMLRTLRLVRIVKFFRPLRILVYSVMNTTRSLFWTLVLLAVLIYLFGLTFTVAAWGHVPPNPNNHNDVLEEYYGDLFISMLTLFQSITGGLDWKLAMDALSSLHSFWKALFLCYIAFLVLFFLNVVTGVVCQTAIESAKLDKDIVLQTQLTMKQRYIKDFQDLFAAFDCKRTGSITLNDFEMRLKDDSMKNYFSAMDLTVDEAWNLFKLLDREETCEIDIDEFVSGCLKLRGTAQSLDLHMLMYQSKWQSQKISTLTAAVEDIHVILAGESGRQSGLSCRTTPDKRKSPCESL